MDLTLSSATLPSESVAALRHGARRRELKGLEWVESPSDGALPRGPDQATLGKGTPPVRWVLLNGEHALTDVLYWSRRAHLLGAGLLLREAVVESSLCVPLATVHGTDVEGAQRAAAWARLHEAQTCWEIRLDAIDRDAIEAVLSVTAPTLGHVRLLGAGPEEGEGNGRSVTGWLFKELALRGYDGTIALAPSGAGRRDEWRRWLFDERGWGCNTAAKKNAAR